MQLIRVSYYRLSFEKFMAANNLILLIFAPEKAFIKYVNCRFFLIKCNCKKKSFYPNVWDSSCERRCALCSTETGHA